MSFDMDEDDLEASSLYPEIEYTTVHQLLDIFLVDRPEPAYAALEWRAMFKQATDWYYCACQGS